MVLVFLVYQPGLSGDFEFDDAVNIFENGSLKISSLSWTELKAAALSGVSGPLGRPLSMVSFALNYYVSGFDPYYMKLTNVLAHLFAGVGACFLAFQLFSAAAPAEEVERNRARNQWLAVIVASVWLAHPLNLTSVLYVVQRMSSLAAAFSFFSVAFYILARRNFILGRNNIGLQYFLLGSIPCTVVGMACKESAALAPLLMLVVEFAFFRFSAKQAFVTKAMKWVFGITGLILVGVFLLNVTNIAAFIQNGYQYREFTLSERLLTQPRVLLFYLELMFLPNPAKMGIYHDDLITSTGLFDPVGTAISILFFAVMLGFAMLKARKYPVLFFGVLWFLVGHSMESSFVALEMMHEHRNYLPMFGPVFSIVYFVSDMKSPQFTKQHRIAAPVVVIGLLLSLTFVRALQWSDLVGHAATEVRNHPDSLRANYQMGRLYFKLFANDPREEFYARAAEHFQHGTTLSKISVFSHVGLLQLAYKARKDIDRAWITELTSRLTAVDWEPNMVAINGLIICQVEHYCKLRDSDIVTILEAPLKNQHGRVKSLASANSMLGNYYILKMSDPVRAKKYLMAAVQLEPDRIEYRLDYVGALLADGNVAEAEKQFALARENDKYNLSEEKLNSSRALIDRVKELQKSATTK